MSIFAALVFILAGLVFVNAQFTCNSETGFTIHCRVTNGDSNNAIIYDSSLAQRQSGSVTGHLANSEVSPPLGYLETYDWFSKPKMAILCRRKHRKHGLHFHHSMWISWRWWRL
eukprot:TRINITY_DN826_c0_g2_i1.p1 TRINITY_DN826_c0_g2~~TRINITY_DN826_c0_g2_i1.p1  ORF type:complete len:114 (-),score=15.49 TRINITY_DN826_c0_g2_i1:244-585(-)